MVEYKAPLREYEFVLREVLQIEKIVIRGPPTKLPPAPDAVLLPDIEEEEDIETSPTELNEILLDADQIIIGKKS